MTTMIQQRAKIYLAEKRERIESPGYRQLLSIGKGNDPLGNIMVFSEETLASGETRSFGVEEDSLLIFIPLVGTIEVASSLGFGFTSKASPEELISITLEKGTSCSVVNSGGEDLVNYIRIQTKVEGASMKKEFKEYTLNKLNPVFEAPALKVHFGVFDGRREAKLIKGEKESLLFAFAINGAFEVQNRLLEPRDGLVLWDADEVELEALSENAIVLILEA